MLYQFAACAQNTLFFHKSIDHVDALLVCGSSDIGRAVDTAYLDSLSFWVTVHLRNEWCDRRS